MLKSFYPFYKTVLCLLVISIFASNLNAQDTITVQTITLDTDDRAGVFTFPDDPGQTYEKILMRYQIRCHDLAVGNGNVGCREWDYSCNTFITDSTRVDSLRAFHPNYIISNFSGTEYSYTQQPVFEYTQYEQTEVIYNNTLTETTAQVGTGTTAMNLAGDQTVARAQFLFTADELTAAGLVAGPVTSLRMDVTEFGDDINFMRIKMKHSTKAELLATDPDLNDFTEVYFLSTSFQGTGEHPFLFSNDFEWDGTSNVIVEFSFTNQNAGTPTGVNGNDTGFNSGVVTATPDHALLFSGSGYIPVDATPLAAINNEMTVAFWSKGGDNLPVNTTIFEGVDDNNLRQANVHLPWSNGQVYWDCGNLGGSYDRVNAPSDPTDFSGQWSHWAFTKNAATGNMTVYLNGEVFVTGSGKTNPIDITVFQFARGINSAFYYHGAIDELQVWDVALDQSTIQNWMRQEINSGHPNYSNLLAYFQLNEGTDSDLSDASSNANNTTISGASTWQKIRGKDLYKDFVTTTLRPNINFVQGTYEQTVNTIFVIDSVPASQNQITAYEVVGTDLNEVNNFTAYTAGTQYIHNEMGEVVDSFDVAVENTIDVFDMEYYNKFPSKYEILSLVTPYGNGLDLGPDGKTFVFDVTDYGPILKGNRRLSIEMGGQNQTEMDIRFLYITGTPTREVKNIQNIWPFRRGWFGSIQDDALFEPRFVATDASADAYEIRSSITGHGQNGEFVERTHYLNIDGGSIEYPYEVWKECGAIPIYPQGGTWIFDRAGWCPGDPTDVNRFDITEHVTPGQPVEIDYGLLGGDMSEANYLVSNQLVTYGAPNFGTDAAILDVIRPSLKVEHERFNPACNLPTIVLQNNGMSELTSATINYQVQGGTMLTYNWTGELDFLETETVELPVEDLSFWDTNGGEEIFEVSISNVNGAADEYANNNSITSAYATTTILEGSLVLNYKTNNRGEENEMYIRDHTGAVVLERASMDDNTTYVDELDLPAGCYSLEFKDDGGDGLDFWFWNQTGANVGTGYLRIRRETATGSLTTIKTFEPDFGSVTRYDFVVPQSVSTLEPDEKPTLMSIYPNPTGATVNVDLIGFENKELIVSLYNMTGQKLRQQILTQSAQPQQTVSFEVGDLPSGVYQLEVFDGKRRKSGQVVVE
ncbi:MAG: LamG-like jellyroll fold domain-containing protein [Saprospiraceae bacterium]